MDVSEGIWGRRTPRISRRVSRRRISRRVSRRRIQRIQRKIKRRIGMMDGVEILMILIPMISMDLIWGSKMVFLT